MKIERVIITINKLMEKHHYGAARAIIENEWARVTENRHYLMLNSEAKELVKVIIVEKERGIFNILSDKEKRILKVLNQAVQEVKFPYAKKIFDEHRDLFNNSYARQWLTADARYMCQTWEQNV